MRLKCWNKLQTALVREHPGFRLVGVWARQRRGAWHIHAVCNRRFNLDRLQNLLLRSGFGPSFYVQEIDANPLSPTKIARYISGYCTDKNGLDREKDKGVRRMIFVGKNVKVHNMRYRSQLKRVTSAGREMAQERERAEFDSLNDFQKHYSIPFGRKKASETWGDWYRRSRDYWFDLGWEALSDDVRKEIVELDGFVVRYLQTGQWSYV